MIHQFDRILESFEAPTELIKGLPTPQKGVVSAAEGARYFLLSAQTNAAFVAVNRLLKNGIKVARLQKAMRVGARLWPTGSWVVYGEKDTVSALTELGVSFSGTTKRPSKASLRPVQKLRIGLWDRYGGSMPSGWIRWLLEQHEFDFEVVLSKELGEGKLREKFDALIFPPGAISSGARRSGNRRRRTQTRTGFGGQLKSFLENGGSVVTIGSSTALAKQLKLPIESALVTKDEDGEDRPLKQEEFFIPGSVVQVHVDNSERAAWGAMVNTNVMFRRSPIFRITGKSRSIRPIAWFDTETPLRSGWAWGQEHLNGGVAMAVASVGKGELFLFGPDVTYRAQPHASFRFVFNTLY